jgi:hypothetical protein
MVRVQIGERFNLKKTKVNYKELTLAALFWIAVGFAYVLLPGVNFMGRMRGWVLIVVVLGWFIFKVFEKRIKKFMSTYTPF